MARLGASILLSAGAALVLLSACERSSAVASRGSDRAPSYDDRAGSGSDRRASIGGGSYRQDENVRLIDGKPIWSSSRKGSAEENAQRSFDRNGQAFGAHDLDDYIRKAQAFVGNPPPGVEKITRRNGDVLLYDARENVFAVASRTGAPKAMFKPDKRAAYWQEQKDREARPQSARADRSGTEG
jgi:hypothetical protein